MYVLGLMSGTSADGVDAVLADFKGNPVHPKWKLIQSVSVPYASTLRRRIVDAGQNISLSSKEWLDLVEAITEVHSDAALACDPQGQAEIVGCHGQTVFHRPPNKSTRGGSIQLLQGPLLAHMLHRPVIYDFRAKDLALGGQGAPLVPLADSALVGRTNGWQAFLNLGGIANITLIPPLKGPDSHSAVLGWDCGPANSLLDLAMQKISKGKLLFDRDGVTAAKGLANETAIKKWLKEPFFSMPPPKSTGREKFGLSDLKNRLKDLSSSSDEDLLATLPAFTASIIPVNKREVPTRVKSFCKIELKMINLGHAGKR